MPTEETERWKSEEAKDLLAIAALSADRFHVLQPPAEWNQGRAGGGDLDCWIGGLDPQWPLRLPPGWWLVQALQDRFTRWQWWLEGPHGKEVLDTTEDPTGLETGIGKRALPPGDGITVPPAARAIYLTQKRLYKGMLDATRWEEIAPLAAHEPDVYRRVLEDVFGPKVGRAVADTGLRGVPPDDGLVAAHKRAHKLQWSRHPIDGLIYAVFGLKRRAKRLLRPTGLTILVVGPDGSGKSTFAAELISEAGEMFRRNRHIHWRPSLLPPISRLLGRSGSDTTRPHGQRTHSLPASYAALGYYWLDNLTGGWGPLRHARRRTGLVLVERGWWDIAIDPRRYRMRVGPRAVRILGSVLPRPDLVFLLEGPARLLAERKGELPEDEIDRQIDEWRELGPDVATTVRIDVSKPVEECVAEARDRIVRTLEARTMARVGTGWVALPTRGRARFLLPRGPAAAATSGLSIYHPMTFKGRAAWEAARLVARAGGFRLVPRGVAPPHEVRELLAEHVPRRGTMALQRTNHEDRWVALVIDGDGRPHRLVKLSTSVGGGASLRREAENLARFSGRLPAPLSTPELMSATDLTLVLRPVAWKARRRPWCLPRDVAHALGRLATGETGDGPVTHGDLAPWNLLKTQGGWVVIDWEDAGSGHGATFDVFHYIVQAHVLLGRPTQGEIEDALDGRRGPVAGPLESFVAGAGIEWSTLQDGFLGYLQDSKGMLDPGLDRHRTAIEKRDALLTRRGK